MNARLRSTISKIAFPAAALILLVLIWQLVCSVGNVPKYMLPSPADVIKAFGADGELMLSHARVTLTETFIGLFSTVAIAPLLVIWLGYQMLPKIVLIVLVVFFPITISLLEGFSSVDGDTVNLMRSMGASRLQIFRYVKLPNSLGQFFSSLKISVSYAVVSAVVSEWIGGTEGLGCYMTRVRKSFSSDKMFAVIILISVISLILIWLTTVLQHACMPWERAEKKSGVRN